MYWFRRIFRKPQTEAQLDSELRFHLEQRSQELADAGIAPEKARRLARIEFGGMEGIKEECRESRRVHLIETLLQDIRYGLRIMRRSPGFTAVALLTLSLGIGVTSAIFSVVDGVLLRPLPFPQADRLVTLGDRVAGMNLGEDWQGLVTAHEVVTYQRELHSFASLGGYGFLSYALSGVGRPDVINAARMTPSVFATLGVAPLMGRVFTQEEDEHEQQVAVLSYRTWKSRFNGNPNVLGTKILLDREPYIVIGVMPRSFEFPLRPGRLNWTELWVPMSFAPSELSAAAETSWGLWMVGRLKPGAAAAQAEADANQVAQQIIRNYPPDQANFRFRPVVYPLQQITVLQVRPLLRLLSWAVAVVLLFACANFAGLLLVRAIQRQRETAVRLALGAPARTLLRQTIAESLVLSLAGGAIGIGLAIFAIYGGWNRLLDLLPLTNEITLNWTVAGFALLLAVLTGVFCGLAPGFAALRTNVNAQMNEGGRSGSGSAAHARLRSALVVLQIAVALMLLAATGLFLSSFQKMNHVNLGFQPEHVTTAAYSLPEKEYSTHATIDTFNVDLLQRLQQLPGVQYAALASGIPATGGAIWTFVPEGYVDPRGPDRTMATPFQVTENYFRAMGIPLLRGRYFTDTDNANSQLVVIVNHKFAEHYWPDQDPIGKRMRVGLMKSPTPWMTIIGEVADAKLASPDMDMDRAEQFYQPLAQEEKDFGSLAQPDDKNGSSGYVVARSALPPDQMESGISRVVRELDPQLPLSKVRTMDEVLAHSEGLRRFNTVVIASFALAAVLLAGLGIYSIVAFSVASRMREIAIRLALGSQRADVLRLVLVSGAKLAAAGIVIGLAGAAAASRLVRSFLFHVSPFDPAVLVLAAIAVFALAFVASTIPARRATRVDPNVALRYE